MIKKLLIIFIMIVILLCAGCMTTYDLAHAATIKTGVAKTTTTKSNYKKPCKSCSIKKVRKSVTKASKKTIIKISCPCCGDGASTDCVYYIHNEKRHMTAKEIEAFCWLEWHYLGEDGQWYEVRTGNNEPVEKPDYVTRW